MKDHTMPTSTIQAASICASVAEDIRVRSAAHEMLAALRAVLDETTPYAAALAKCLAAVAKAEGRT